MYRFTPQAARFMVVPAYEGDFVTIRFPDKTAKFLSMLDATEPERMERFRKVMEELEGFLYEAGERRIVMSSHE